MTHDKTANRKIKQRWIVVGVVVLALAAGIYIVGKQMPSGVKTARTHSTPTPVDIVPPEPKPLPPKLVEPPKEMELQPPDSNTGTPEPKETAPAPETRISTTLAGPNGSSDLVRSKGQEGSVGLPKFSSQSGSRFGWYALQIKQVITDALSKNDKTRMANFELEVRIWPDATGRIQRAKLGGTTGDPAIDAALTNEILPGLQLREPPPQGMLLPINMRLTIRRAG